MRATAATGFDHLARELSLDLSRILLMTRAELHRLRAIDVFCHIGQHLYPIVPAMGQRSFYMCRFPFLMNSENSTEFVGQSSRLRSCARRLAFRVRRIARKN